MSPTTSRRAVGALAVAVLAAAGAAAPLPSELPRRVALGRILELEDRRSLGDGELEGYLRSRDPGVRRRAALAAGRIGAPSSVPALIQMMNDPEVEIRQMAAFAMGLIGDARSAERLLLSLQDPEAIVRARAVEALGRLREAPVGPEVARAVVAWAPAGERPLVIRGDDPGSTTDPWLPLRLGLFALARLGDAAAAETALLEGGRPRFDWWAATWTAMRLESPRLRPVVVAAAGSSDPLSRALAARGLGALKDASALPPLEALVSEQSEIVAVHALRALAFIGDARAVGPVAGALRSENEVRAWEALKALAQLPPEASVRAAVLPLLGDPRPWMRAAALPVLGRIDREEFALVLSGMDPDPQWWVRAAVADALGKAGDPFSLGALNAMLNDDDPRVLPAVLAALRNASDPGSAETLRRHLQHDDPVVRAAAAEGLVALKATGLTPALVSAYRSGRDDGDLEARLAIVDALAAQPEAPAAEALREIARTDGARVVRARAAAALRARGEDAPDPGQEPVTRPPVDYRLAMAPFDPQADAPLYTPRVFLHTSRGVIEVHLNVVEAPLTSAHFLALARRGFYDGLTFHRVIPHFVAQGGDPRGDGAGGPGYTIRDEVGQRPFARGAVGIALAGPDTGGSQFFITLSPQPHLDGTFTVFGWVAEGMDVADRLRPGDVIERVAAWTGP